MRYDPFVYDRKTVFMQRLADFVRLGYRHYTFGEVSLDRAPALVAKFSRLYGVHLHRNQRAKQRADGLASAYLLLWRTYTDTLAFCLLITPGPHTARTLEKLEDATQRESRLTLDDYELVLHQRAGAARPSWTWRFSKDGYDGWRLRALQVCRVGNDFEVTQFLDALLATPGFAGIREQVKRVKALFRAEWKRRRPDCSPCPLAGARQRYVQRLSDSGTRMSALLRVKARSRRREESITATDRL